MESKVEKNITELNKKPFIRHQNIVWRKNCLISGDHDINWLFEKKMASFVEKLPRDTEWVDIGTTNGGIPIIMDELGFSGGVATDIFDISHYGYDQLKALTNHPSAFRNLSIYDMDKHYESKFDCVFFLGVLYHLRHPLLALDRLHTISKEGALIFLETLAYTDTKGSDGIDIRFFTNGMFGDNSNWNALPETGIPVLLEMCGFEVLEYSTWNFVGDYTRAFATMKKLPHPRHKLVSYQEYTD